jgi:hypothetical protein
MAINISAAKATIKTTLKDAFAAKSGKSPEDYEDLADVIADGIAAGLQHIKDNADLTDVQSGNDTVEGGVD